MAHVFLPAHPSESSTTSLRHKDLLESLVRSSLQVLKMTPTDQGDDNTTPLLQGTDRLSDRGDDESAEGQSETDQNGGQSQGASAQGNGTVPSNSSPVMAYAPTNIPSNNHANEDQETSKASKYWKIWTFGGVLLLDTITTLIFLTTWIPAIAHAEGLDDDSQAFNETVPNEHSPRFFSSLWDLALLAVMRIVVSSWAILWSYYRAQVLPHPYYPLDLYHPNGERKSTYELEQERLEESFGLWFRRFIQRPAFTAELLGLVTQLTCVIKCLDRLYVEIGTLEDTTPHHPLFWVVVLVSALLSVAETTYLEAICELAGQYGKERWGDDGPPEPPGLLRRISSSLSVPLLATSANDTDGDDEERAADENGEQANGNPRPPEDARGVSDITSDPSYRATWRDLSAICAPDLHLIIFAFTFLLLAAIAQVYIPRYLGNILDALEAEFASPTEHNHTHEDDPSNQHKSMFDVPGFMENVKLLIIASILAGVFAGLRGSIFTVVGGKVNVRLRTQLMDSLLSQDIGFFDVTKTGDITSRLSSDTTLVGDQVTLNINIFLRSLVQALGVLLFMFIVSWQLSILAFISVPLITLLSRWYGEYVRSLTKLMQKKLADGNSVSEAALGAMPTVRAFDAAESELREFEVFMRKYLDLNVRAAISYCFYAAITTSLPQLVVALVVFYGGMLVRNGDMTSGQLVSFLLYLSSLSDAFTSIGYVFSSLSQAVGAADKVFELMKREPKLTTPRRADPPPRRLRPHQGILGIQATKTMKQRSHGLWPSNFQGEITFDGVDLYYPARPQRKVLDSLSLNIKPGSVVALVGESGGGKSSIVSLIQHLYEQSAGSVLLDGHDVRDVAPSWLSEHVSVVSQQPTLFGRSIRRNIMFGLEGTEKEPTQEEIEAAARLANADSFIQRMPQKYDTEVGEKGVQLSGGQRQRIAIARALVRKPRVLLLDEATSALDSESEHYVQQAIDDMIARGKSGGAGGMTVIIIAHRLSTVRSADCIYVVKAGKVVERGCHDDLIQDDGGFYSALIRRQLDSQRKLDSGGQVSS